MVPTRTLLLGFGFVLGLAMVSCSDGEEHCVAGAACICEEDCNIACGDDGAGCAFECRPGAKCEFDCPGGNCAFICAGESCILNCPGNNCAMTCSAAATTCEIRECSSSCVLECWGAQNCMSSCGLAAACATLP